MSPPAPAWLARPAGARVRREWAPGYRRLHFDRGGDIPAPGPGDDVLTLGMVLYAPGLDIAGLRLTGPDGDTVAADIRAGLPSPGVGRDFADDPAAARARTEITLPWQSLRAAGAIRIESLAADGQRHPAGWITPWRAAPAPAPAPADDAGGDGGGAGGVPVTLDGVTARFSTPRPEDAIQAHHVAGGFYEPALLRASLDVIPAGGTVIDAGANVGNHTIFWAAATGAAEIIPLEPGPAALGILHDNLALNPAGCVNCAWLGMAVSDHAGQYARIDPVHRDNLGSTRFEKAAGGDTRSVTVDSIIGHRPCHLLKVDVEGMEMPVLRGAAGMIGREHPAILVEVTAETRAGVTAFLSARGYALCRKFQMYPMTATLFFI